MPIYFMYCRKSSEDEDRQIISNESQEHELDPIAARDGLVIRDRIKEEASAKESGTRPNFNKMLKRIKKDEANAIMCWHLNRLSRNATDAANLIELMDRGKLVEIRTPGQTFRNTPGDKFLVTLFCSQAKLENDNKGVDVKRGLKAKAAMGHYPGVAPQGYLNDKTKNRGERDLYNDPERFDFVKQMWRMLLVRTHTPPQILKIANEEWGFRTRKTKKTGGKPLSISGLYHIFHNPFYYGWYEYPTGSEKWYEGKHEPMVTREEFEQVQMILGRNGSTRPSRPLSLPYMGIMQCGNCEGMITAEEKHQVRCTTCRHKFACSRRDRCPRCKTSIAEMSGPQLRRYVYYHCARRKTECREPSLEVNELEKLIAQELKRVHVSAEFNKWAFRYLQELYLQDIDTILNTSQSREKALADCVKRLDKLVELKTSPRNEDGSLLSDEEYSDRRRMLLQEKAMLESSRTEMRKVEYARRQTEETFKIAEAAPTSFVQGDVPARKEVLARIGSNLAVKDKKLIIKAIDPFAFIREFKSDELQENESTEPQKSVAASGQNGPTDPENSSLLRDVNKVRTNTDKIKVLVSKIYCFFRSSKCNDADDHSRDFGVN
jgi:site-specific DNA recombinase